MTNPRLNSPSILVATCFGVGLLSKAPGTWGSLVALPFAWILLNWIDNITFFCIIIVLFFIGLWASASFLLQTNSENKDPKAIVVDEVVGQWLVLAPFAPDFITCFLGFLFFRLFDILKPWPINWVDSNISGSLGIMLDDILAAIYSILCLILFLIWKST